MHETLISAEEWLRVKDEGDYFRIQPEFQGLEYDKYFSKGQPMSSETSTYNSENTKRLNVDEAAELLLTLPEIQEEIRTYAK